MALAWRERQGPTPAWARRYSGHFVQAMDFLDDSLAQAVARQRAAERRKRVVGAGVALSLLAMLALTMNWVSQDYERRLDLENSAQRTLEEVGTVTLLATQYAEHKAGGEADEVCANAGIKAIADSIEF